MKIMHRVMPFARLAAIAITLSGAPHSAVPETTTPEDFTRVMAPDWCRVPGNARDSADRDKDQAIRAKLYSLAKSGCNGYQHYCSGLVASSRALLFEGETPETQRGHLLAAISDYGYVLTNSTDGCSLFPDIYTKIGEIQARLGQVKEGEISYKKAIKIQGGYAPAFVGLSDLYENQGDMDKALAVLQLGLKTNPQSSVLKKKLARVQARKTGQATAP